MKKKGGKMVPNCVPVGEEKIEEKNVPTNPSLWSKAKSLAKSKFDVYPSAYANMYASGVCSGKITPGGKKSSRKKAAGGGMINRIQLTGFGAARK